MWQEPSIYSPALPVLGKARVQSQPQPLGEDTESPSLHSSPWEGRRALPAQKLFSFLK